MQKRLIIVLFFFTCLFILPHISQAQRTIDSAMPQPAMETIRYPGPKNMPSFFGHEQAYTVTFRGNGEAHVVLKVAFTNSAEATSSAVFFNAPTAEPKDLVAYQVIREGQCIVYKPDTPATIATSIPECATYDEPNYFEPYYYGNVEYKKASVALDPKGISVLLPESISPEKSGSILLFYTSPFYTSKTFFGAYKFNFETLKVDAPIRSLQVGINTDTNMNIKGVTSEVQYKDIYSPSLAMEEFSKGYSTDSTSRFFSQIGTGRLIKNAYELQPNETYTVTGMYAKSWWSLYSMEVIIGIAVLLVFGIIIIVLVRKLYGKLVHTVKNESSEESVPKNKQNVLVLLGISFISSFLIAGFSAFQFFVVVLIERQYYDSTITIFIGLVLFLVAILIYGLLFVGPPLFVGLKKGTMWGIGTFVATLCWLFIYVMIFLLFAIYLRTIFSNQYSPIPMNMPYMEGVRKSVPAQPGGEAVSDVIVN